MHPATLSRLTLLVKARRDSVPSARRIVEAAAAQLGLDWQTCDDADRVRLLHAARLVARAWLRREAERAAAVIDADQAKALFGKARAAADRFFSRAGKFIRASVLAGWLAIAGPGEPSTVALESLNRGIAEQHQYLDNFRLEVLEERKRLIPARAEQYGGAVWTAAQNARRAEALAGGAAYERRVHVGADEPCEVCREQVGQGWVPAGRLRDLGDCLGGPACHCHFEYRATKGLKDYHPGQARDAHGRWTSAGGGRYQHNTAITGVGYPAEIHRITQEINSGRASPGRSKRRIWRAPVRSRKQGELRIKVREHRKKVGRKLSAQRRRNEARRARDIARETRYHQQDLARLDREHARAGTTGSAEHVGQRERMEREHTRLMGVVAQNHRYDRDAERAEHRYEAALARQHHRDTEAIYLRQRHERLTERD